jgi:hypothetical protein
VSSSACRDSRRYVRRVDFVETIVGIALIVIAAIEIIGIIRVVSASLNVGR